MRTLACRVAALVVVSLGFPSSWPCPPVWAEPPTADPAARNHHERATVLYDLGQFEEAIAEYRKGYEQTALPVFLFNIAQAYRQLGENDKALFFYRRYLSIHPEAENRAQVAARVAEIEQLGSPGAGARRASALDSLSPAPLSSGVAGRRDVAASPSSRAARPFWRRPWFWAGVGALVIGGLAIGLVAVSPPPDASPPATDLGKARFF